MTADPLEEHRREFLRLEEDARYTEKAHFAAERRLRNTHHAVGVLAIASAAVAAASVLRDVNVVTGVSALISAIASGYQTFANPGQLADRHLTAARELGNLKTRIRQAVNLKLDAMLTQSDATVLVESLTAEKADIDRDAPGISETSFKKAQKKIARGDFTHAIDQTDDETADEARQRGH